MHNATFYAKFILVVFKVNKLIVTKLFVSILKWDSLGEAVLKTKYKNQRIKAKGRINNL